MNNNQRLFLRFILAFSLFASICGCVKEDEAPIGQKDLHEVIFHAGWAPETKTVLQEDGNVWWSPGDQISVFTRAAENGGYILSATIGEPSPVTDFVGMIGDGSSYYAIYPYSDMTYFDGEKFGIYLFDQVAKEGTFPDRSFISIAHSTNNNLYFRNICGGIKISVAN